MFSPQPFDCLHIPGDDQIQSIARVALLDDQLARVELLSVGERRKGVELVFGESFKQPDSP